MFKVALGFPERCKGCGVCENVCPHQAIKMYDGTPLLDAERCEGDEYCIKACPEGAIIYVEEE
jgi:pyruvate formate lyase activating enzyme